MYQLFLLQDEHGQSMLHFAVARTHTRNALFELLQESDINLAYRDELYRTARDVSIQANLLENTAEIDKFVIHLAARGKTEKGSGPLRDHFPQSTIITIMVPSKDKST